MSADAVTIGDGLHNIWIVWRAEYDGSAEPTFLAAYDGQNAEQSARALVDLLNRAQAPGNVDAAPVPLWPLLKSDGASDPSPDRIV